jgi:hypothetical protein
VNFKELERQIKENPQAREWNMKAVSSAFEDKEITTEQKATLLGLIEEIKTAKAVPKMEGIVPLQVSFGQKELNDVFSHYSPAALIALFEPDFHQEFDKGVGVHECYTLRQHTMMVLNQFEKYFSFRPLPGNFDVNAFRVMLLLHDIGKPLAITKGGKHLAPRYTPDIMRAIMTQLGFSHSEVNVSAAFVSGDPMGTLLKYRNPNLATEEVRKMKAMTDIKDDAVFLELLLVYYKCDAGSYTEDAGGQRSLDFLFDFRHREMKLEFAPDIEMMIHALRQRINR